MGFSVPCPFCTEPIREEAYRCPRCHAWLVPWSYRHKWFQGIIGIGLGTFLIYDGAKERFLDAPSWVLWTIGGFVGLYGLYHLFRSPRESYEEGRKELFERYRKPIERGDEEDEDE